MCAKDTIYLSHRKWRSLAGTMGEEKQTINLTSCEPYELQPGLALQDMVQ